MLCYYCNQNLACLLCGVARELACYDDILGTSDWCHWAVFLESCLLGDTIANHFYIDGTDDFECSLTSSMYPHHGDGGCFLGGIWACRLRSSWARTTAPATWSVLQPRPTNFNCHPDFELDIRTILFRLITYGRKRKILKTPSQAKKFCKTSNVSARMTWLMTSHTQEDGRDRSLNRTPWRSSPCVTVLRRSQEIRLYNHISLHIFMIGANFNAAHQFFYNFT